MVESNQVTTPDGPVVGLVLSGNGYKQKGKQKAQLNWTGGGSNQFDIFRDDAAVEPNVSGASYLDHIDLKGGGNYVYRVCVAGGTDNCSNDINIVF